MNQKKKKNRKARLEESNKCIFEDVQTNKVNLNDSTLSSDVPKFYFTDISSHNKIDNLNDHSMENKPGTQSGFDSYIQNDLRERSTFTYWNYDDPVQNQANHYEHNLQQLRDEVLSLNILNSVTVPLGIIALPLKEANTIYEELFQHKQNIETLNVYRKKNMELVKENLKLKDKVDDLEHKIMSLKRSVDIRDEKISDLEQDVHTLNAKISEIECLTTEERMESKYLKKIFEKEEGFNTMASLLNQKEKELNHAIYINNQYKQLLETKQFEDKVAYVQKSMINQQNTAINKFISQCTPAIIDSLFSFLDFQTIFHLQSLSKKIREKFSLYRNIYLSQIKLLAKEYQRSKTKLAEIEECISLKNIWENPPHSFIQLKNKYIKQPPNKPYQPGLTLVKELINANSVATTQKKDEQILSDALKENSTQITIIQTNQIMEYFAKRSSEIYVGKNISWIDFLKCEESMGNLNSRIIRALKSPQNIDIATSFVHSTHYALIELAEISKLASILHDELQKKQLVAHELDSILMIKNKELMERQIMIDHYQSTNKVLQTQASESKKTIVDLEKKFKVLEYENEVLRNQNTELNKLKQDYLQKIKLLVREYKTLEQKYIKFCEVNAVFKLGYFQILNEINSLK